MQDPVLFQVLSVPVIFSVMAFFVMFRAWMKTRLLPTLLYTLAALCFLGMALDLFLDQQTIIPFRDLEFYINSQRLWVSNVLLAFFVVAGFLFWYFAIMYSQFDNPPRSAFVIMFLVGAALMGELEKMDWSAILAVVVEALAFSILIVEIVRYARRVLPVVTLPQQRTQTMIYFVGFLVWILAAPLGIVLGNIEGTPSWIGSSWPIPYSLGFLMISVAVGVNPRLLFISKARPLNLLILDKNTTLVFSHKFREQQEGVDPDLMGTAMSGVISLMKEMLASEKELQRIDHGDTKILLEHGPMTTFLLIVDQETVRFRQALRQLLMEFEADYREELIAESPMTSQYAAFKWRVRETFL